MDYDSDYTPEYMGEYLNDHESLKSVITRGESDAINSIPFYRRILDPIYDPFSLYEFETIEKGNKYVSDEIGDDYKNWMPSTSVFIPNTSVFITAQTGSGKNTFVEDVLLNYLMEKQGYEKPMLSEDARRGGYMRSYSQSPSILNYSTNLMMAFIPYKVLILSNRIALNLQMKIRILKKLGLIDAQMSDQEIEAKIKEQYEFGFITILAYQGFRSKIGPYLSYQYTHVILDECHFFTSDALFNPHTGAILKAITEKFRDAVKIYMSATMEDSLRYICDYELLANGWDGWSSRKEFMRSNELCFKRYNLRPDYSYLNIKYFRDYSELAKIITKTSDKWLIFIDDKKRGEKFKKEQLNEISDKVILMNSEKKKSKEFYELLEGERLPTDKRVLISTSLLDNGISFNNKELENEADRLKNIVVEEIDRVKCLQMVGRIRPAKNDNITLYIKVVEKEEVKREVDSLSRIQNVYNDYYFNNSHPLWSNNFGYYKFYQKYYDRRSDYTVDATKLFYRTINSFERVFPNAIAVSFVDLLFDRCSSILNEIGETRYGWNYLEFQHSWFDRSFNHRNDDPLIKEFWTFLKSIRPSYKKEERPKFALDFKKLYLQAYETLPEELGDGFSMLAIKKVLEKLNTGLEISMASDKLTWLIRGALNI